MPAKRKLSPEVQTALLHAPLNPITHKANFEEDYERLKRMIKKTSSEIKKKPEKSGRVEKVFVFSCFHVPFHRGDLLVRAVEEAVSEGARTAVVAGDFLDCYGLCAMKMRRSHRYDVPLKKELEVGQVYIEYLSDRFNRIYVILGNHLDRVRKWFAERIGPEYLFLVKYNLMELITEPYGNFSVVSNTIRGNRVDWMWRYGDLVITHREKGSSRPLQPTVDTHNRLQQWIHVFGQEDYRCLIQAHTHLAGTIPHLDGKYLLMEAGCMCQHPQYSFEATLPYPYPQTCAYEIVTMINGRVDFNNTYQRFFSYNEKYPKSRI